MSEAVSVINKPNVFNENKRNALPAPEPLPNDKIEVMKFNINMMPDSLQPYIDDVSTRMQCPADFIAVGALCSLASLLGNQAVIKPKVNDDWRIYPTLWGMIVAPPSAKKSPALKQVLKPISDIEKRLSQEHERAIQRYKTDMKVWEIKSKKAHSEAQAAINNEKPNEALAHQILNDIQECEPKKPIKPNLSVNNVTLAKLGEIMSNNPNGLLYFRDELSGLLSSLGREDNSEDRAFLLECFDGGNKYTFERIERGSTKIDKCTLSMLGGIQPSELIKLVREAVRYTRNDGLLQRFQLGVYPESVKKRRYIDIPVNQKALCDYNELVNTFHSFDFNDADGNPRVFNFDVEAQNIFIKWFNDLCADSEDETYHSAFISHIDKLSKTIPTLALIFELIETKGSTSKIGARAIAKACSWSVYLMSHANAIYGMATNSQFSDAKRILGNKDKLGKVFTIRDINRKQWSGLTDNKEIQKAVDILLEYNYVFILHDESQGMGRKTTKYFWNEVNHHA